MDSIKKRCSSFAAKAAAAMGAILKPQATPGRSRRSAGLLGCVALMLLASARLTQAAETVTYYYTDQQGTVLATADAAGNILTTTDYRPYGAVARGAPEEGPGYTGHVDDTDTGLVYMQARYYDPAVGRFLSVDWDVPGAANVIGFNRFAYAANDPVGNADSNGRCVDGLTCDTMARSFAMHPEATRSLAPIATVGVAIMAAPTVVLVGAAAFPEAASAGTMTSEQAADLAVASARQAAIGAQSTGATGGAASAVVTESGEVFTGLSTNAGGPGVATNPLVQEALDSVPEELQSPFHGCCGEINAYSNLLNAGAKVEGSTAATVRVTGSGALDLMKACATCQAVSRYLRVKTVSP